MARARTDIPQNPAFSSIANALNGQEPKTATPAATTTPAEPAAETLRGPSGKDKQILLRLQESERNEIKAFFAARGMSLNDAFMQSIKLTMQAINQGHATIENKQIIYK